ncbi:mitochondrial ribosomal protein L20 [Dunaliella salina]|uniref:50S ribosomal protein L20 n=1 Tax=Dunaliella salina TaxID=3046 RepID=A0ABQ7GCZ0_DUNSA|nr:mitochondrial ribosomal protein L20 [Dunaliella salina]|eukprot:KAF5832438.1 mitochondrial ribosomal protein L20 [Dunaliella salina]
MPSRLKLLHLAKGFRGRAKNVFSIARSRVHKALQHAYRGRREKKREMRALWIQRINAGAREHGLTYSQFLPGLSAQNIHLNRKVLSELAMTEPFSFKALADQVKMMKGPPKRASS